MISDFVAIDCFHSLSLVSAYVGEYCIKTRYCLSVQLRPHVLIIYLFTTLPFMAELIELVNHSASSINDASPLVVKAPPGAKLSKTPTVILKGQEVTLERFLEQDRKANHPYFVPTRVDLRYLLEKIN